MKVILLQARMSSSRLPGKVLRKILNKPLLELQVERIMEAKNFDKLIVITSSKSSDDIIGQFCKYRKILIFRGSLYDVLDRFYQAAKQYNAQHIIRLTADCPLIDPGIIDNIVQLHLNNNFDYSSNVMQRTFPDGLDVEVMTFNTLKQAWLNAKSKYQREHVTPWVHQNIEKFKIGHYKYQHDLSRLRWTVDYAEDLIFIKQVYDKLYQHNPKFTWLDVLQYLKQQEYIQ